MEDNAHAASVADETPPSNLSTNSLLTPDAFQNSPGRGNTANHAMGEYL